MEPIDWSALVKALVASGLTQPQIAEACGCGQSTLSDLLNRRTLDPRVSLAMKLLRLASQRDVAIVVLDEEHGAPLIDVTRQRAAAAAEEGARDAA